jgi:hypothetical protein
VWVFPGLRFVGLVVTPSDICMCTYVGDEPVDSGGGNAYS